jgi:hypothetical protein
VAGYRDYIDGFLIYVASSGYYWSSTVSGTNSSDLAFDIYNAFMNNDVRADGFSVRCIKD